MGTQPLQDLGRAPWRKPFDLGAQIGGAEPGDRPLTAPEGEEKLVVRVEKQVEAAEGVPLGFGRRCHLGDGFLSGIGIV